MNPGIDKRSSEEGSSSEVKISIIVPVYNVAQYLNECLESLARQTLGDMEVICIDDGSTDGSAELLDAYVEGNGRFRAFHQENHGVTFTRNKGLDLARGEYILFVDSDDAIAFDACDVLYKEAKRSAAEIVVFGGKTFPTLAWADASFAARDCFYKNGIKALLDEQGSIPLMCNKLYSREFLEHNSLRFHDGLVLGEDHAFQMIAFPYAKSISYISAKLYFYRIREDSAVGNGSNDATRRTWLHYDVVRFVLEEWDRRGILEKHFGEGFSWAVDFISNSFYDCDYDEKFSFSHEFIPYLKAMASKNSSSKLNLGETASRHFEAMEKYCENPPCPFFTIVVDCSKGIRAVSRCVESLKHQSEDSIEIFLLNAKDIEDGLSVEGVLRKDRRLKLLGQETLIDILEQVRGGYLLSIDADVVFAPTALKELRGLIEEKTASGSSVCKRCDVVTFADSANLLGVRDFYQFSKPFLCEELNGESLHPRSDFGDSLLSFAGIFSCNKVFNVEFLKDLVGKGGLGADSWFDLQFFALLHAEKVLPTMRPLITFYGLGEESALGASSLVDMVSRAESAFVETELARKEFAKIAVRNFILISCFAEYGEQETEFLAAFQLFVKENHAMLFNVEFGNVEDGLISLVEQGSFEDYRREIGDRCREFLLKEVGDYRLAAISECSRANSIASEFYNSASYRLGRSITAIPRAMIGMLKKVR